MRGDAADARVDLVEDERLAARHRGERERDARELASGGRLGDRAEREACVGPDEERGLVHPARAKLAFAELDEELSLPQPEPLQLGGDGLGERACLRAAHGAELLCERADPGFRGRDRLGGGGDRIEAGGRLLELLARRRRPREQLLERRCVEAALEVCDPRELALDLVEPPGVGLERGEERVQIARYLA